jgi:hypothetical protein
MDAEERAFVGDGCAYVADGCACVVLATAQAVARNARRREGGAVLRPIAAPDVFELANDGVPSTHDGEARAHLGE